MVEIDRGSLTEFPFFCKVKIRKVCKNLGLVQDGSAGSGCGIGKDGGWG